MVETAEARRLGHQLSWFARSIPFSGLCFRVPTRPCPRPQHQQAAVSLSYSTRVPRDPHFSSSQARLPPLKMSLSFLVLSLLSGGCPILCLGHQLKMLHLQNHKLITPLSAQSFPSPHRFLDPIGISYPLVTVLSSYCLGSFQIFITSH